MRSNICKSAYNKDVIVSLQLCNLEKNEDILNEHIKSYQTLNYQEMHII